MYAYLSAEGAMMGMYVLSIQPNTSQKISYSVKFGFFPLQHDYVAYIYFFFTFLDMQSVGSETQKNV